jgi:hypothetical protein
MIKQKTKRKRTLEETKQINIRASSIETCNDFFASTSSKTSSTFVREAASSKSGD